MSSVQTQILTPRTHCQYPSMLGPFERHPSLKWRLASCEWVSKWIGPLRVGDELRLVSLPKRLRLLLPFDQKIVAPVAYLGDEQCMEVSANLQEGFRVADTRWHLERHFGGEGNVKSERVGVLQD